MSDIQPGTYRISSECSGTAITVPEWNEWDVVCWHKHDGRNQQWYLQRSGGGYRIKNCANGHFLAVSRVSNGTPVYCGRYPTTWVLNRTNEGTCTIKCGDDDRVIDLDGWGKANDGNHMHLHWQGSWMSHRRWWFERLNDDSGEEEPRLRNEIDAKNQELASRNNQIAEKDRELAKLTERFAEQNQELNSVKNDLAEKSGILKNTLQSLCQANEEIEMLKSRLERAKGDNTNEGVKQELARQQEETNQLRNKMDAFEKLVSQMLIQETKRPNNMA